jgi:hypothetical protein
MDVASPQTLRLGPIVPDGHTHQQTEVGMVTTDTGHFAAPTDLVSVGR